MREMLLENPDFLVRVRCRSSEFVRESLNVEGAPPQQVRDSIAEESSSNTATILIPHADWKSFNIRLEFDKS